MRLSAHDLITRIARRSPGGSGRSTPLASINERDQTPSASAIAVVFGAESRLQQFLFRGDAGKQWHQREDDEQPNAGAEGEHPAQRHDEQAKIARVADRAVNAGCDEHVAWLNCNPTSETTTENEDRRHAQAAARRKEEHSEPAELVAVQRPETDAVGIGGKVPAEQGNNRVGSKPPAIAVIPAFVAHDMAYSEERCGRERERHERESNELRAGEKGTDPAGAEGD